MAADPYKYFRIEARQLVEQLGHGALELEKGLAAKELTPKLLRLAHTLKGAARVVKQGEIADLAHAVEDALSPLRDRAESASREQVDGLLARIDAIRARLPTLEASAPEATLAARESVSTLPTESGEMDQLLVGLSEAMAQLQSLRQWCTSAEEAKRSAELLALQLSPLRASEAGRTGPGLLAEELRTEIGQLEGSLSRGLDVVHRELRQVLDMAERLRLLPTSVVFLVLERVARDAALSVHKQINFTTEGGEIRLDADILHGVQKALVQLVRNAIAHGIEDGETRIKAGKPAIGMIQLRVVRRGSQVSFVCQDDGRGIDLEAVRRVARDKGRAGAEASEEELFRILLTGGLSTSETVTQVSGRGVGLDVVREVVEGLRGQVSLRSVPRRGTELEILVPVSLAAMEVLLVEAAGKNVAIPLDSVQRVFRISPVDISTAADGEVVMHDDQVFPLVSLSQTMKAGTGPEGLPPYGVVVRGRTSTAAVGVDRVLGATNVVLRPLPAMVPAEVLAVGACLDSDGNAQLVLDETRLVSSARRRGKAATSAPQRLPILIVDDSLTTRMLEQSILESAGYEVRLAASAEEGLEMAQRQRYGLFLVDVEMPGMDGFSFVQKTRSDVALREVPAILVTSRNAPEDRRRGMDAGALSYIVKSEFDQEKLLEIVRRVVG